MDSESVVLRCRPPSLDGRGRGRVLPTTPSPHLSHRGERNRHDCPTDFSLEARHGQDGNVLLLSLFVLSALLISTTTLSAIVLRDLRSGRALDDGQVAYYSAESGIEQSLYALRRENAAPAAQNGGATLPNGSSFVRAVTVGEPVFSVPALAQDDYIEINLFDPSDLAAAPGIESISIDWTDSCAGASSIELSYTEWPAGATIAWPTGSGGDFAGTHWKFRHRASDGLPWSKSDTISSGNGYRMRIKAEGCALQNLEVRAFADEAGTIPKDVPSRIAIKSTGKNGATSQALTATMQRLSPLSGLFDFVIFGEDTIVK